MFHKATLDLVKKWNVENGGEIFQENKYAPAFGRFSLSGPPAAAPPEILRLRIAPRSVGQLCAIVFGFTSPYSGCSTTVPLQANSFLATFTIFLKSYSAERPLQGNIYCHPPCFPAIMSMRSLKISRPMSSGCQDESFTCTVVSVFLPFLCWILKTKCITTEKYRVSRLTLKWKKRSPDVHHPLLTGLLVTLARVSKRIKSLEIVQLRHFEPWKWISALKTTIKTTFNWLDQVSTEKRRISKCRNVSIWISPSDKVVPIDVHSSLHKYQYCDLDL